MASNDRLIKKISDALDDMVDNVENLAEIAMDAEGLDDVLERLDELADSLRDIQGVVDAHANDGHSTEDLPDV